MPIRGRGTRSSLVPLAAVAEMADRTHFGRWDENLGQVLYIYFPNRPAVTNWFHGNETADGANRAGWEKPALSSQP